MGRTHAGRGSRGLYLALIVALAGVSAAAQSVHEAPANAPSQRSRGAAR